MDYGHRSDTTFSGSDVLSTLTSHGGAGYRPSEPEYVIHTHSVPLATAVDLHYLREERSVSLFHGYEAGNPGINCPKRACMYITKQGTRTHESVPDNCPCLTVKDKNGEPLKPRCFLAYIRSLGKNLCSESDEAYTMDPASIMFCQTAVGLFDNKYPGWFRDAIGVSGWEHVGPAQLTASLRSLYWYRVYTKQLCLDTRLEEALVKRGFRAVRHAVTQALHTLNGLLIKRFMAFCPESTRYQDYAKQTAYLFRDLLEDYLHPLTYEEGKLVSPEGMTYIEIKNYLNLVKASFHSPIRERRVAWLDYEFQSKSLRRFFNEIGRLKAFVETKRLQGSDYTESPAWIFRATTICQTRSLGYLPQCIAEVKRKQFRDTVSRPMVEVPREKLQLIAVAVRAELDRSEIPMDFMFAEAHRSPEKIDRFREAIAAVELPLKGSASTDTYVRDGGKIEDARLVINLFLENDWEIPIRDLRTNAIVDTIRLERPFHDEMADYVRPLFWISYNVLLNWSVRKGFTEPIDPIEFRKKSGAIWEPDPMLASIVHISEPGKERNLTKSTGFLTWFLTPASKIVQDTLAVLPEHRAGLKESGHEWRHQKRIAPTSNEASFMYHPVSGLTNPGIVHSFKDWTESTDFICKQVGWVHLETLLNYISFPEAYRDLIADAILEPQPVTEVVSLSNFDEDMTADPVTWSGEISEGFMMGNPMTKSILHLIHVSERSVVREILERMGSHERGRGPYLGSTDSIQLDRSKVTAYAAPTSLWS